jgi:hypothetical protein
MISYDFHCKVDTTTTFLKSPLNPSSANSQLFFFENENLKNTNTSNIIIRNPCRLANDQFLHNLMLKCAQIIASGWCRR